MQARERLPRLPRVAPTVRRRLRASSRMVQSMTDSQPVGEPEGPKSRWTTGLRSSNRGDWRTPIDLYRRLVTTPGRFDVSDTHGGTFDARYDEWPARWFCNPEYGRQIAWWTTKMRVWSDRPGVALIPARTDTKWFHASILPYARLEFIPGRLHFDGGGPAPFPSLLAWFAGDHE